MDCMSVPTTEFGLVVRTSRHAVSKDTTPGDFDRSSWRACPQFTDDHANSTVHEGIAAMGVGGQPMV